MAIGMRDLEKIQRLPRDKQSMFFMLYASFHGSLAAIIVGMSVLLEPTTACAGFRFLGVALTLIGVALLILTYISTSLVHHSFYFKILSMCCSVPLIVALLVLGIFAVAASSRGGGKPLPERGYKEYSVESYSKWMQMMVNDTHNWDIYYKNTVVKRHGCKRFSEAYGLDTLDEFHQKPLNPFESGCCKPPEDCNFNYTTPTVWVKPENGNYSNKDCDRWNNDPTILCYNCQSCKAAFVQDVKSTWFRAGLFIVVQDSLLLLVVCLALIYVGRRLTDEDQRENIAARSSLL